MGPICSRIDHIDPHRVALRKGKATLTYAELNQSADLLSAHLSETGLKQSATVGICLERSFDWVIAALAVMRAGGAYVAMDASWPDERIRYVLADSGATHIFARTDLLNRVKPAAIGIDPRQLALDTSAPKQAEPRTISPDDLAYIIYTSGTSGYPKGVEITHRNLAHLVEWHCDAFQVTERDRASHLAGLSFDAAAWEIWPNLAAGATMTFNARQQNQRPGLALANGTVYIAWASHEDDNPFCGWVMAYDASTLKQQSVLNITPNTGGGGIWMNGSAPAVDANGNLFFSSGNGIFDGNNFTGPSNDYSDSMMEVSGSLSLQQFFTPSDEQTDEGDDIDLGSGGSVLIDLPANGSNPTHLLVNGGKDGTYYIVNRDKMGGYGNSNALQLLYLAAGIFVTPAYWNNTLYVAANNESVRAYTLDPQTGKLVTSPISSTENTFGFPGTNPAVSAMPDGSNAILWTIDYHNYCTNRSRSCGPAVLHAYSATNLATELWNSSTNAANTAGYPVKYTVPTVANGHVYIGTRGNNIGGPDSSTSIPGELDVYGILSPTN